MKKITLISLSVLLVVAVLLSRITRESETDGTQKSLSSEPLNQMPQSEAESVAERPSSNKNNLQKDQIDGSTSKGTVQTTEINENQEKNEVTTADYVEDEPSKLEQSELRHSDQAIVRDPKPVILEGSPEHLEIIEIIKALYEAGEAKPFNHQMTVFFEWRDYAGMATMDNDGNFQFSLTDPVSFLNPAEVFAAKLENLNVDTSVGNWSPEKEYLVRDAFESVFGIGEFQFDFLNCRQRYCLARVRLMSSFNDSNDMIDQVQALIQPQNARVLALGYTDELWLIEVTFI